MRRFGLVLVALAIGCAFGMTVREVVFPARASGGPAYAYRVVDTRDLIKTVHNKHQELDGAPALEAGLNEFGRSGWRVASCLTDSTMSWGSGTPCSALLLEVPLAMAAPAAAP